MLYSTNPDNIESRSIHSSDSRSNSHKCDDVQESTSEAMLANNNDLASCTANDDDDDYYYQRYYQQNKQANHLLLLQHLQINSSSKKLATNNNDHLTAHSTTNMNTNNSSHNDHGNKSVVAPTYHKPSKSSSETKNTILSNKHRLFSIFLTGPPGAGKTTQLQLLQDYVSNDCELVLSQNKALKKEAKQANVRFKVSSKKPKKQALLDALMQQGKLCCSQLVRHRIESIFTPKNNNVSTTDTTTTTTNTMTTTDTTATNTSMATTTTTTTTSTMTTTVTTTTEEDQGYVVTSPPSPKSTASSLFSSSSYSSIMSPMSPISSLPNSPSSPTTTTAPNSMITAAADVASDADHCGESLPSPTSPSSDTAAGGESSVKPTVWVYSRGPSSMEQAKYLYDYYGIAPDMYIVLEVNSVQSLIDRVKMRRIDPVTQKTYHLKHDKHLLMDEELRGRLVHRNCDDERLYMKRLSNYKNRMEPVVSYYEEEVNPAHRDDSTGKRVEIVRIDASRSAREVWADVEYHIQRVMNRRKFSLPTKKRNHHSHKQDQQRTPQELQTTTTPSTNALPVNRPEYTLSRSSDHPASESNHYHQDDDLSMQASSQNREQEMDDDEGEAPISECTSSSSLSSEDDDECCSDEDDAESVNSTVEGDPQNNSNSHNALLPASQSCKTNQSYSSSSTVAV